MLNIDNLFGKKATFGKRITTQVPVKGAARFFFLSYTHFAKLVGLNMLFLLFCIPVITIPAALSGLNRVCILLVREGTCNVWSDFIKEFKSSFKKSIPLGILCAFLIADAAICFYLGMTAQSAGLAIILLIASFVLYIWAILMSCHIFVLLSLISLKNCDIIRDAILLIMLGPKTDLFLIVFVGGGFVATTLFPPIMIPVIAVIGFALLSLAASTILNEPIQNRIITQASHPM